MNSKILAYVVMDGDEMLRKTGPWEGLRPGATVVPLGVVE